MNFTQSKRLDDKLTGVLIAALSTLLVSASVQTFCAPVPGPALLVAAHQAPAANPAQPVLLASAR